MKEYNISDGKLFNDKNQVSVGGINISKEFLDGTDAEEYDPPHPCYVFQLKVAARKLKIIRFTGQIMQVLESLKLDAPGLMAKIAYYSTTNKELTTKILPHRWKLSLPILKCGGGGTRKVAKLSTRWLHSTE